MEGKMTPEDKEDIIRRCGKTDRTFLYIMMFICMLASCDTNNEVKEIKKDLYKVTKGL